MKKKKLQEIKKRLIALSLAGVVVTASGCASNVDENGVPKCFPLPEEYSRVENYYKYVIENGEATKLYNSKNVYILFDKENYDTSEYIFNEPVTFLGGGEIYDLESEELLVYSTGAGPINNELYYRYIAENNYQVCLADTSDYVEGHETKEYYSLDEIHELEPQIEEGLKTINSVKKLEKNN